MEPNDEEITKPLGMYASGAALVDLDGDGDRDVIVANGNDMAPQPMTIYLNRRFPVGSRGAEFSQVPDWISPTIDHHVQVCAADFDGDGGVDFVTTVPFGRLGLNAEPHAGRADFYFNKGLNADGGTRGDSAFMRLPIDIPGALGCAIGDVNGDGRLDVAIAAWNRVVVYLNRAGRDFELAWSTEDAGLACPRAFGALLADLDDDGWLDLVVSGRRTMVFYNTREATRVPFPNVPDWPAGAQEPSAADVATQIGLDVGLYQADSGTPVFVTTMGSLPESLRVLEKDERCKAVAARPEVVEHQPIRGSAGERVNHASIPGPLRLAFLDFASPPRKQVLAVTAMGEKCESTGRLSGAPLYFFSSPFGVSPLTGTLERTNRYVIGEEIAVADLRPVFPEGGGEVEQFDAGRRPSARRVFTLPRRRVERILGVSVDGASVGFIHAPNSNVVQTLETVPPDKVVVVSYQRLRNQDLFVTTWNPELGDHFYFDMEGDK